MTDIFFRCKTLTAADHLSQNKKQKEKKIAKIHFYKHLNPGNFTFDL